MRDQSPESVLREEIERARTVGDSLLENLLYHRSRDVLGALLENPRLGEKHLAILLARRDLPREIVTRIAQNRGWMKSYPMKVAVVKHPQTPRYLALPLLKNLYLFDLLGVALTPGVAAELKRLAEETILSQQESLALGQRLTLARRGSPRIVARLLADPDRRVIEVALSNPALTEQGVADALVDSKANPELTGAVLSHRRWSCQYRVKLSLLRSRHLTLARVMAILPELILSDLGDLVEDPRVTEEVRAYVTKMLQKRAAATRGRRKGRGLQEGLVSGEL